MGEIRIAQLSDTHLLANSGHLHKGVNTWLQLEKILHHLACQQPVDGIVLTGDLAQDEERKTYEALKVLMDAQSCPYWVIPGNHDDPHLMRDVFWKEVAEDTSSACFCVQQGDSWVFGLDTHMAGSDGGALGEETARWFKENLQRVGDASVLIFMHHPPADTGNEFSDSIGLEQREEWLALFQSRSNIKGIGFGHLHRPLQLGKCPLIQGAPSTAYGMEKTPDGLKLFPEQAGYQIWSINEGEVSAEIVIPG